MAETGPPDGWDASATLMALRELVTTGARVNHVVARRAGISDTELVTLEHLSREQIGPAEVARRLEVSTAAATWSGSRTPRTDVVRSWC